jgi:hypothetical protein
MEIGYESKRDMSVPHPKGGDETWSFDNTRDDTDTRGNEKEEGDNSDDYIILRDHN